MMFIIGTGSTAPTRRRHSGRAAGRQLRRRLGDGEADAEDGVGAEPRLVGRAVQLDHRLVDGAARSASTPASASKISPLTASTAFSTPLPP
jgi:hypothetical protein